MITMLFWVLPCFLQQITAASGAQVRVKIVLDVTYLGTRFCGWQALTITRF
jgi:hypothetical protein